MLLLVYMLYMYIMYIYIPCSASSPCQCTRQKAAVRRGGARYGVSMVFQYYRHVEIHSHGPRGESECHGNCIVGLQTHSCVRAYADYLYIHTSLYFFFNVCRNGYDLGIDVVTGNNTFENNFHCKL